MHSNVMWMELCTTWALHFRYAIPPLLHKQRVRREMKDNFCRCNKENVCVNSLPAVFCTQCLMDPRLILVGSFCAGLVVSSWITYEIFESPERCMMNEAACYLYAYRAHWLATGSARGSGSKWNSTPGQYIIKRNVCAPKLTSPSSDADKVPDRAGGGLRWRKK